MKPAPVWIEENTRLLSFLPVINMISLSVGRRVALTALSHSPAVRPTALRNLRWRGHRRVRPTLNLHAPPPLRFPYFYLPVNISSNKTRINLNEQWQLTSFLGTFFCVLLLFLVTTCHPIKLFSTLSNVVSSWGQFNSPYWHLITSSCS